MAKNKGIWSYISKRGDSAKYQFEKRWPSDVAKLLGRVSVKFLLGLFLIGSALTASHSWAEDQAGEYQSTTRVDVQGWHIFGAKGEPECMMTNTFEDDSELSVSYNQRSREFTVMLMNPIWKSLKEGGDLIDVRMVYNEGETDEESYDFKAGVTDQTFGFNANRDEMEQFYLGKGVTFMRGKLVIGKYSLKGTKAAMEALLTCSGKAFLENPIDPFAD